jgi:anhydro-N-acetylmuramic acid kinase
MALVEVTGHGRETGFTVVETLHTAYSASVRNYLLKLVEKNQGSNTDISQANFFLARLWSEAVHQLLNQTGFKADDIDLVGSHGQTIYHQPNPEELLNYPISSTLQIGDPAVIAQLTGITTVGDFRVADVARGGEGAPLVPYFDLICFSKLKKNCLVLNIGGIANFTFIPADGDPANIIAFDTGPGNMLTDQLMQRLYEKPMDRNGKIASLGQFSKKLFDYLIKYDPFPGIKPPKSTGREHYGEEFVIALLKKAVRWRITEPEIIHTVSRYTPFTIRKAYENYVGHEIKELYVGGGGAYNRFFMKTLQDYFKDTPVKNVAEAGISQDYKEAICFAILANECIHGSPAGMPKVTGAGSPAVLGKICQVV